MRSVDNNHSPVACPNFETCSHLGHSGGKANRCLSHKQPNEKWCKVVRPTANTTLCAVDEGNGLIHKVVIGSLGHFCNCWQIRKKITGKKCHWHSYCLNSFLSLELGTLSWEDVAFILIIHSGTNSLRPKVGRRCDVLFKTGSPEILGTGGETSCPGDFCWIFITL